MDKSEGDVLECAICLQTCMHPVQLPCSHIFCFLCVKGVAIQSKRCALCRQDIPVDFFNNPALLRRDELYKESVYEGCYQWYYQGNQGWWQYDERASSEIEECFKAGNKHLEILIAGFLYIIDYDNMLQFRRNDPSRRRKIKRDLISIPDRKGVAGLKVRSRSPEPSAPHRLDGDGGENVPCVVQSKQPKQKPKTVVTRASNNSTTRAVLGQASGDQTASVGQSTVKTQRTPGPGHASQSRPTNKSPRTDPVSRTSIPSPSVPHNTPEGQSQIEPVRGSMNHVEEQTDDVIDSLSSQVSNVHLSETPSASRVSRRTRSSRSKRNGRPAEAQLQSPSSSDEDWQ